VRTIARECFTLGTYIRWHLLVLATRLRRQEAEDRVRCRGLAVIWETEVARSNGFEKYRSVTLRVSSPVMDVARDAASEEGISLNSLANRQLRQYAEWDRLKHKLGYVTVRDRVFQHILEKLPEDEIVELGRQLGEVEAREYVMLNWRIMSPDHFIRFVDNYARYSGALPQSGQQMVPVPGGVHGLGPRGVVGRHGQNATDGPERGPDLFDGGDGGTPAERPGPEREEELEQADQRRIQADQRKNGSAIMQPLHS